MLLIKHDNGMMYTPGVNYNLFRNNSEAVIEAYDRDGKRIKEIKIESTEIEVTIV